MATLDSSDDVAESTLMNTDGVATGIPECESSRIVVAFYGNLIGGQCNVEKSHPVRFSECQGMAVAA